MSGDVQPRKRKDKKKKKEDDDITHAAPTPTPAATGVKTSAMGPGDVHMHVHSDHGTGGHWCAKVVFFALLAVLGGLVVLIILENRGLSDVDTPLSESRFSEYFEGWVDEKRESHDEHEILESLNELDSSHEHDNEPFAEEEDHGTNEDHEDDDEEEAADDQEHENDDDDELDEEIQEIVDDTANDEDDEEIIEDIVEKISVKENFQSQPEIVNEDDDDDDADDNVATEENNDDDDNDNEDENTQNDDDDDDDDDDDEDVNVVDVPTDDSLNFDDDLPFEETNNNANLTIPKETLNVDSTSEKDILECPDNLIEEKCVKKSSANDKIKTYDQNVPEDKIDIKSNILNTDDEKKKTVPAKISESDDRMSTGQVDTKEVNTEKVLESKEITPDELTKQVDELIANYNKLAESLDKPKIIEAVIDPPAKLEDDDADDDGFEKIVDNDDGEDELLQKLSEKNNERIEETESPKEESSIAVKIFVGLAIVIVAPIVLVKKSQSKRPAPEPGYDPQTNFNDTENELYIKRRFTLISAEDNLPIFDDDDQEAALHAEIDEIILDQEMQELYSDEEYSDEDYDDEEDHADDMIFEQSRIPQTFEEMNAMFRSKVVASLEPEIRKTLIEAPIEKAIISSTNMTSTPHVKEPVRPIEESKSDPPIILPEEEYDEEEIEYDDEEQDVEYEEDEEEIGDEEEEEEEIAEEEYEEEEAELSDVDDYDLMKRLEEKYGKIKEPTHQSDEEEDDPSWTKIPPPKPEGSQSYKDEYDEELQRAEDVLRSNPKAALKQFETYLKNYPNSLMALYGKARALDKLAEQYKSNQFLEEAIQDYINFLQSGGSRLNDTIFKEAAERCILRMRFKGKNMEAISIHEAIIERFPDEPHYRNQLALTYLLINRLLEAKLVLHDTLLRWRSDGFALVHYGFILKNLDKNMEEAVMFLTEGIETKEEGTQDGRFYLSLGEALQRLGKIDEAHKFYEEGAKLNLFPSKYQRSLYNVNGLKAQPFWTLAGTTYETNLKKISNHWTQIRDEGLKLLSVQGYFVDESENLRDVGDWKQFELFVKGQKLSKNCLKAPLTCKLIEEFVAASKCKRGQVKFSVMHPGTHVWPHCGPTNCRVRAHLGLRVPDSTYIRVAEETRSWKDGKWLIFDDSFEHEVWHNGTETRLVLIVDVWHPDLTETQRKTLHAI